MVSDRSTAEGFAALGLSARLIDALASLGYEEPTAIQREAIPRLLAGDDVLGQAATGTGKTAAFALPLLQRLGEPVPGMRPVQALILVPTRELAMQVAEAVHKYGRGSDVRVVPIYGGQSIGQQFRALERGVDVVVGTPGRVLDHLGRGSLNLASVQTLVLDEADEMLDMGFADELEAILKATPRERQTALFSATMAKRILEIAKRHLRSPVHVTIPNEKLAAGETARVREIAYIVQRRNKPAALARVLDMEAPASAIVFCRTRIEVDELTETLGGRGYSADALHGGLSQEQRDRVLRRFRDGVSEILVATDVAARGLDIEGVSHVVNFDVPSSPDAYVHRIGRTGRAGRDGVAVTLAEGRESRLLRNIEQFTKRKIAIESVPTAHDLRARRLELMRTALEETLTAGGLDAYRRVVESLASDHDALDIAAAAAKLADEARDGAASDEADIPRDVMPERPVHAPTRFARSNPDAAKRMLSADMTRIYINLGRTAGIRPADLVGAIANEAKVESRAIGAIDIADGFSIVEVANTSVDDIIEALRGTKIRGKSVSARRDRKVKGRAVTG
jgi:ATP-dependent RNA helicase DeaD